LIYNAITLNHHKTITVEGDNIMHYAYSNCQNYFIICTNQKNMSVISVIDIMHGKVITTSYLAQVQYVNIIVNPFKNSL
jgi:hypothetical protein